MIVPYMLNGFHPVRPYIETTNDSDNESKDNGLIVLDGIHNENSSNESAV